MKIYIAGKVTGEPVAQCTMKFGQAQKKIEKLGHEAINPLQVVNDWKTTWQPAMRQCITALMAADAVLFLSDYEQSTGALLEEFIARKLSIPCFYSLSEITPLI
jgi:hypothetical protein